MGRVIDQGDLRPMADNPQAMDDLRAILESRTALYAKAGAEVNTADKTQAQAFAALLGASPRPGCVADGGSVMPELLRGIQHSSNSARPMAGSRKPRDDKLSACGCPRSCPC